MFKNNMTTDNFIDRIHSNPKLINIVLSKIFEKYNAKGENVPKSKLNVVINEDDIMSFISKDPIYGNTNIQMSFHVNAIMNVDFNILKETCPEFCAKEKNSMPRKKG